MNSCHFCLGLQLIRYCWILVVLHKMVLKFRFSEKATKNWSYLPLCFEKSNYTQYGFIRMIQLTLIPPLMVTNLNVLVSENSARGICVVLGLNLIYRNSKLHLINLQRAVKPIGILPPHWLQKQNLWINSQTNMKRHICNQDPI